MDDQTYTIEQAAAILGITGAGVRQLIYRGSLPAHKHGRDWAIRKSDLDKHQENRRERGRPPERKTCRRCKIEKPIDEFSRVARLTHGRNSWCRACWKEYKHARRQGRDGEIERAYCKTYYLERKQYFREKRQRWYRQNKEHQREHYRAWRRTPIGRAAMLRGTNARRIRLAQVVNDLTNKQLADLLGRAKRCAYCKRPFTKQRYKTIDHVIPLSKGGAHTLSNLTVACKSCNSSKHDTVMHLL